MRDMDFCKGFCCIHMCHSNKQCTCNNSSYYKKKCERYDICSEKGACEHMSVCEMCANDTCNIIHNNFIIMPDPEESVSKIAASVSEQSLPDDATHTDIITKNGFHTALPEQVPVIPYAYIDGSFNNKTKRYGFGGFLVDAKGDVHLISGSGSDAEMASMRNVAGEIMGATKAIEKAEFLELPELLIYYDYIGIENWVTGKWKANKTGTQKYRDYACNSKVKLKFEHVKSHSGIKGNERADQLARRAVGL